MRERERDEENGRQGSENERGVAVFGYYATPFVYEAL